MSEDPASPSPAPASSGRSLPKWTWVIAVGLLLIVAWQVGRGVFVKSIDAPGGGSIQFYPPESDSDREAAMKAQQDEIRKETQQAIEDAQKAATANGAAANPAAPGNGPNSANSIEQTGGTDNSATIHGDHNHIQQTGQGNRAVIGGN